MNAVLTDLDDLHLTFAIKGNLYAFFRSFAGTAAAKTKTDLGLFRWHTAIAHPWFNGVLPSSTPDNSGNQQVQETLAYFRRHKITGFTWWLEPWLASQSWEAPLIAAGFQFDSSTPGMAAALENLPPQASHPADFTIQAVEDAHTLHTWTEVFIRGYELPEDFTKPFYELISSLGIELPYRHYLGYLDGQPVSTATLFLGSGVAGIYNVATLAEARRMGLGAAITLQPLLFARNLGYKAGILQSSEMGFHIYTQLGFHKLCTMDHFYWQA
jgi:hypothetical protein